MMRVYVSSVSEIDEVTYQ